MAAMPEGEVFTVREIAKLLKVKMSTVRALIKNGDLKAGRVGHNYRVGREELQEYMIQRGLLRQEPDEPQANGV